MLDISSILLILSFFSFLISLGCIFRYDGEEFQLRKDGGCLLFLLTVYSEVMSVITIICLFEFNWFFSILLSVVCSILIGIPLSKVFTKVLGVKTKNTNFLTGKVEYYHYREVDSIILIFIGSILYFIS